MGLHGIYVTFEFFYHKQFLSEKQIYGYHPDQNPIQFSCRQIGNLSRRI